MNPSPATSFSSDTAGSKSERDRFVEALNSGSAHVNPDPTHKPSPNNVDFLFGLEKGGGVGPVGVVSPPPVQVKVPDIGSGHEDQVVGPGHDPVNIQSQLQRLQIREQEQQAMYRREQEQQAMYRREQEQQTMYRREQEQQTMYRKNSDDNLVGSGGYPTTGGEYYVQKYPEKVVPPPASLPVTLPPGATAPAGYWPEKHIGAGGGYPPQSAVAVTTTPAPPPEQQVYVLQGPTPGTVYHTPVMRQVTGQTGQYYMQRMGGPPEVYREQPVYNMVPPQGPQQQQTPPPITATGPMGPVGGVRPSGPPSVGVTDTGYAPMAYDNTVGRQVYYTAQGGVNVMQQPPPPQPQYQGVGGMAVSGEMRHMGGGGAVGQDGKVMVSKVTQ